MLVRRRLCLTFVFRRAWFRSKIGTMQPASYTRVGFTLAAVLGSVTVWGQQPVLPKIGQYVCPGTVLGGRTISAPAKITRVWPADFDVQRRFPHVLVLAQI